MAKKTSTAKPFVQNYISYDFRGERIFLPLVNLRLYHHISGISLRTYGLVDSGSTATFIPTDLAEHLGVRMSRKMESVGAGGTFETRLGNISIAVLLGSDVMCDMGQREIQVPVSRSAIPYVVLGRDTLFQEYDIKFMERSKMMALNGKG